MLGKEVCQWKWEKTCDHSDAFLPPGLPSGRKAIQRREISACLRSFHYGEPLPGNRFLKAVSVPPVIDPEASRPHRSETQPGARASSPRCRWARTASPTRTYPLQDGAHAAPDRPTGRLRAPCEVRIEHGGAVPEPPLVTPAHPSAPSRKATRTICTFSGPSAAFASRRWMDLIPGPRSA